MGLFNDIEKGLATGATVVGDLLQKAGENTDGWGQRADEFFSDEERWAGVKTAFENAAAKAEEVFNKIKDEATKAEAEFMKEEDVVRPDTVKDEDCCGTEGNCCEDKADEKAEADLTDEEIRAKIQEKVKNISDTVTGLFNSFSDTVKETVKPEEADTTPKVKDVDDMNLAELREAAKNLGITGASILKEKELAILVKALS